MPHYQNMLSLPDQKASEALGVMLANLAEVGDIIALHGDLGAGKSTLARAVIQSLAKEAIDVPSPTFTLVQTYETPTLPIWHYDLYRLEHSSELRELGFDETDAGLALIEWPERMGHHLPEWSLHVWLDQEKDEDGHSRDTRLCCIESQDPRWISKLENAFGKSARN